MTHLNRRRCPLQVHHAGNLVAVMVVRARMKELP